MISKDMVLDSDNELVISGGDFLIGQSDDQNIEAIIRAEKGQFYQWPLLGYGIGQRINAPVRKNIERRDIRAELRRDNYNVTLLTIEDDFTINIDAIKEK